MSIAFLICNLACLAVLILRRYWRIYPWFCAALAAICWQAGAMLFVVVDDRATWMHRWAPGEIVLLILTGAAVIEALWRSVEQMHWPARAFALWGLIGFALHLAWALHDDVSGDWYAQLINTRTWLYLAFAVLAFSSFWSGMLTNRVWPRVARMHSTLLAVLMVGHVSFGRRWEWWAWANTNYRIVAVGCCVGWCINAGFLAREFSTIQKALDEALRSTHGSGLRTSPAVPLSLRAVRIASQER